MSTLQNFKKRLIFRVGIAYLTIIWFILQIIATLTPIYDFPGILIQGFAFMFILGYPLVMLMALIYEKTHSTKGWEAYNETSYVDKAPGKIFYRVIIGLIIITLSIMLVDIFILRQ